MHDGMEPLRAVVGCAGASLWTRFRGRLFVASSTGPYEPSGASVTRDSRRRY